MKPSLPNPSAPVSSGAISRSCWPRAAEITQGQGGGYARRACGVPQAPSLKEKGQGCGEIRLALFAKYHLNIKNISRSGGCSIVSAAAYHGGERSVEQYGHAGRGKIFLLCPRSRCSLGMRLISLLHRKHGRLDGRLQKGKDRFRRKGCVAGWSSCVAPFRRGAGRELLSRP